MNKTHDNFCSHLSYSMCVLHTNTGVKRKHQLNKSLFKFFLCGVLFAFSQTEHHIVSDKTNIKMHFKHTTKYNAYIMQELIH